MSAQLYPKLAQLDRTLFTAAAAFALFVASSLLNSSLAAGVPAETDETPRTQRVGTVDFLSGKCGCPTVMVGNRRQAAVLILATQLDEPIAALARSLQTEVMNQSDVHGYLIRLAPNSHRSDEVRARLNKELQGFHETHKLTDFTAGVKRSSGKRLFAARDIPQETVYAIYLLDARDSLGEWLIPRGELTQDQTRTIVHSAKSAFGTLGR